MHSMLSPDDIALLLETAESAALVAGDLARKKWAMPRQSEMKGFRDIVTDADVAVQHAITSVILERFPAHGFLTEEEDGQLPADGPVIWIIDPIDGTTNYSRQLPTYCVSIAAVSQRTSGNPIGSVLTGVVYDPMRDELFSASKGCGAQLRDREGKRTSLAVSQVSELSEAIIGFDWSREPSQRQKLLESVNRLAHQVHTMRAIGAAALAFAWIAAGRLDGYLNHSLYTWDVAAGSLLIEEAGGQLSQMNGQPWGEQGQSGDCVASNRLVHLGLRQLIA